MSVGTASTSNSTTLNTATKENSGFNGLTADDFFKLLLAQLQNQDPADPVSNEQMLNQIATIRGLQSDIEMGDVLKELTEALGGQSQLAGQRLSVAASFIGKSVTFDDGQTGVVTAATLADGKALLQANGVDFELDKVLSVNSTQSLVGQTVGGNGVDNEGHPKELFGYVSDLVSHGDELVLQVDAPDEKGNLQKVGEIPIERLTEAYNYDSLIGRRVKAVTPNGFVVQGQATVPVGGALRKTHVEVGGISIPISHVTEVLPKDPPTTTTTTTTANTTPNAASTTR